MRPLIALLLLAAATPARAEPVATGRAGWLGTWRVLASERAPLDADAEATLRAAACEGCPLLVRDGARLDLDDAAGRGDRVIYLGLTLEAPRPTTLHLFLGFAGEAEVRLDGEALARWERAHDRVDDRHVALPLSGGDHHLVLRLARLPDPERGRPPPWSLRARFLSAGFHPGAGEVGLDLGPLEATRAHAAAAAAVRLDERHHLEAGAPAATLRLHLPAGGVAREVPLRLGEESLAHAPERGVWGAGLATTVPLPDRGPLRLEATVAGERRRTGRLVALDRPVLEAAAAFAALLEEAPASARGPLQWRHEEALRVVAEEDPDRRWRQWLRDEARRLRRAFARGGHPFEAPRGYTRMAHVSALDGSAQPYELFVPPAYRGRRAWPLVITLHGYKGNAGDYFRNTFGLARDWRGGESLLDHGRHGTAPTEGPMIVLAPQARGKSHYRHVGEVDVLEALADVRARYRVDPRRIYITGGSMGGTAAAYLPFRHPDLFAASAALAGYHDQRVRQDTHHPGLSEVERFLVAHRSDVDWSENALHLPMLLVRGTRDRPLAWTRVQAARLRELGYDVEHREPELGHNVWTETYAEGAIFDWFARHRRPERPRRVVLRTARERTNEAYWVRVDGRAEADAFAEVRAAIEGGRVVVETEAVAGLTLSPAPPLVPEGPLRVSIDGQALEGPAPLSLHREGERWALGALELAGRKRAGVSGPIRDVYHEPLVFVVGTQDPAHTFTNRQVARHWARVPGWDVRYPIVDDVDVTAEMIADKTLVLVGPPWSNALHARWRRQLPIRFDLGGPGGAGRAVLVGEARHAGDEVGTVFVAPNPDVPGRSVLVIAGLGPLGTWRARFLPDLLPDWVVFDERVELARGQWSCGGARRDDGSPNFAEPVECAYRDHGLFGMGWELRE